MPGALSDGVLIMLGQGSSKELLPTSGRLMVQFDSNDCIGAILDGIVISLG